MGRLAERERQVLPQCAACKKPILGERVLISSCSGGQDASYHPSCLRCHECRHPLGHDPFVVTDNLRFHRACFFCHAVGCGIPLADVGHFRHKNQNLCRYHYEEVALPRCSKCHDVLRGEYVTSAQKSELPGIEAQQKISNKGRVGMPRTTENYKWCRKCFRCWECKTELMGKPFYEHGKHTYCEMDYERLFAPKCLSCARTLWGKFKIHESGEMYCIPCEKHEPSCFSCGRLVWPRRAKHEKDHPIDLPDGRVACELCARVAIFAPQQADECFAQAKHFVRWLLGREVSFAEHLRAKAQEAAVGGKEMDKIDLKLVDRTEMSTLCFEHGMHQCDKASHTSPMGITLLQKEVFSCARDMTAMGTTRLLKRGPQEAGTLEARTVTRAVRGIRALTGLPPIMLISTLVHELLHYHMFVVGKFRSNPPPVEEGMCELAALLYLRSLPQSADRDIRIRQKLENRSSTYGDGLRAAEQVREMGQREGQLECGGDKET